jgi:hypothetical protein
MKNVQVIDGGLNTTYSIYQFTDEQFAKVFPEPGQDIEFIEDVIERLGKKEANKVFKGVWDRLIKKPDVQGIHGTLFYELTYKKKYYPTKKDCEMIVPVDM